jgi:hypothetical protein
MKFLLMAMVASGAMTPFGLLAADAEKSVGQPLQLRPKSAMQSAVVSINPAQVINAPFVSPSASPEPELVLSSRPETAQEGTRSSCAGEHSLCYDSVSGRVVYKPARQFMPAFPGLRPENISIKRNQLVLRYSF